MKDEEFEKVMDDWASEEIESAPRMRPTKRMYRMLRSRKWRSMFPTYARWILAGTAATCLLLLVLLHPAFHKPPADETPFLAKREGFKMGKGPGRGPIVHRGQKKGLITFRQLVFHYQELSSRSIKAVDICIPQEERISLTADDNYGLLLQPARDLYVYIYQLAPSGKLAKIFPNAAYSPNGNPLIQGQTYLIPAEPEWFYLVGDKGEERIYIIASVQEMADLEDLYNQYHKKRDKEILARLIGEFDNIIENPGEETAGWMFAFYYE